MWPFLQTIGLDYTMLCSTFWDRNIIFTLYIILLKTILYDKKEQNHILKYHTTSETQLNETYFTSIRKENRGEEKA